MHPVAALLAYRQTRVGLVEAEHARKIEPWIVRLEAARSGLREAVERRDRAAALRGVEDTWFWVGRLTAELLAVEDPKYDDLRIRGAQTILAAQREVGTARIFLGDLR